MEKQKNFSQNGITLVALVVTIIILLILAGISIGILIGSGLFDNAKYSTQKYAKEQEIEESEIAKMSNEIDTYVDGNRGTVTLTQEEYQEFKRKGYTILWEGTANEKTTYYFKEESYDVENYDFILIEYYQSNKVGNLTTSTIISSSTIDKSKAGNIACLGYDTRYTALHFIDNGFVIDNLEGSTYKEYVTKVYGINI